MVIGCHNYLLSSHRISLNASCACGFFVLSLWILVKIFIHFLCNCLYFSECDWNMVPLHLHLFCLLKVEQTHFLQLFLHIFPVYLLILSHVWLYQHLSWTRRISLFFHVWHATHWVVWNNHIPDSTDTFFRLTPEVIALPYCQNTLLSHIEPWESQDILIRFAPQLSVPSL